MSSGVFVLRKDGILVEMNQKDYGSEKKLQELLARYPNLLAGNLIDEVNPRQWLFVTRELSIPDENSERRWAIDHLFLDQDGVPTLVEVKRSSDTRIRREEVGQMLEYAANAVSYWNIDKIRFYFESRCENQGEDPEHKWEKTFNSEKSYEEYWEEVKTNLQTGKIRMIFLADIIPIELRQIVEFLNMQMSPAEVLALEIKQYVGKDQSTLIPRLYGQTSKTQAKKSSSRPSKQWDKTSFLKELEEREGKEAANVARAIMKWSENQELITWYGKGGRSGSFIPYFEINGQTYTMFALWTYGKIEIQFQYMKNQDIMGGIQHRKNLMQKLHKIEGIDFQEDELDKRPSLPYSTLKPKDNLDTFLKIWENYIKEIKTSI